MTWIMYEFYHLKVTKRQNSGPKACFSLSPVFEPYHFQMVPAVREVNQSVKSPTCIFL